MVISYVHDLEQYGASDMFSLSLYEIRINKRKLKVFTNKGKQKPDKRSVVEKENIKKM